MSIDDSLPTDLASAHALIIAQRAALLAAQSEAKFRALLIEKLKYTIKKLRHEQFGQSSERGALLDQLELQLADLEENAAQAETAAQIAAADKIAVAPFERRRPARRPLPEHLPRERHGGWSAADSSTSTWPATSTSTAPGTIRRPLPQRAGWQAP